MTISKIKSMTENSPEFPVTNLNYAGGHVTRIIQSLYYTPAGRYINAWMHSLIKSVKPEIVNRYDLWVLRHGVCK